MPQITALRRLRSGRCAVEVDGRPWRSLPAEVVAALGLLTGDELDRPRLRELRRELRRSEALTAATRALRYRDLSRASLERRLDGRGIAPAQRAEAVEALARAGFVDDERAATARASGLAARGWGDVGIRSELERAAFAPGAVERALTALAPEEERALQLVDARGASQRTARYLLSRGFSEEAVASAVSAIADEW